MLESERFRNILIAGGIGAFSLGTAGGAVNVVRTGIEAHTLSEMENRIQDEADKFTQKAEQQRNIYVDLQRQKPSYERQQTAVNDVVSDTTKATGLALWGLTVFLAPISLGSGKK